MISPHKWPAHLWNKLHHETQTIVIAEAFIVLLFIEMCLLGYVVRFG